VNKPLTPSISESPLAAATRFAALHSPYYKAQPWAASLRKRRTVQFRDIPVTPASVVKADPQRFFSLHMSPDQGGVSSKYTSGSTGEPLEVRVTKRHSLINSAENNRLGRIWKTSAHERVVHVRDPNPETPPGTIKERPVPRGGNRWTLYTMEAGVVADLLRRTAASFVTGLPSVIHGAVENCSDLGTLQLIGTVGEIISEELRSIVARMPNCKLFDCYGCTEAGIIAAQCAICGAYHPADRHLAFELISEDGSPTAPGEMGRVIVTPYFNQAMPLIRYELGDYAIRAATNTCPLSQYALERIVGRRRNLFTLPTGRKITPIFPAKEAYALGIRKFKMVQLSVDHVELRYTPWSEDAVISAEAVQNAICSYLSPDLKVTPVRVSDIPRSPSGKYLMHESMVP
jgi:phenylacetate-CoA ligase